ncbi:MAG: protein translocase subunit SecF [Gemmatimonadota bacterium]
MRLFGGAHYDFLGTRRRSYMVSAVLVVIGLFSIFVHHGFVVGVDFTGGTLVQVKFAKPTSVAEIRDAIAAAGLTGAQIQNFESEDEYLIRVGLFQEEGGQGVSAEVGAALAAAYGADGYEVQRTAGVGPKVGSELRRMATIAILMSFALTLVYLAFRFEWRFGVAAIIATVHDIIITFGFISLLNIEITLATVAAILTIIGYSLNDTIVVFDRIRENLKKRRKDPYTAILNSSINETLPRTVLTSGTTLVALLSLFVFGGGVIRPFALVLILGIAIGTYSSIWVASPALQEIENRSGGGERGRSR